MIGVDKIDDIRRLGRNGASVASISRDTGVSEPTVRKYLREQDLSERPPEIGGAPGSPLLEPFEALIDSWLLEDRRCWRKQRHTAKRVYDRLVAEEGFEGSYSTVQRYVRRRREELAAGLDAREAQGFLLLDWLPGECQVDFGQADLRVRGVVTRGHFLVVSFPHSNVGFAQVFWGETAECVCQGLKSVIEFVGGVPLRAVFDNATEVGRRVGAQISTSALFRRFAAHYGLDYSFTNPYSGNEKGSVENKVGALRRNLFVPMPQIWDVKAYNGRLLDACLALSEGKLHTARASRSRSSSGTTARRSAAPLGAVRVRQVDHEEVRQAGLLQGRRRAPLLGGPGQRLARGRRRDGRLRRHGRRPRRRGGGGVRPRMGRGADGLGRPRAPAEAARRAAGGWRGSVVRRSLPDELVAFLDWRSRDLGADLRALRDVSALSGWAAAVEGA